MKKGLLNLATLLVATFMTSALVAQDTSLQTSTAATPIWYNMNSAATAAGATNAALAQVTSTGSFGEIVKGTLPVAPATTIATQNQDKYLWRFESDGSGNIYIINKLTGMKVANPTTAVSGLTERFRMNATGSTFAFASVAGITTGTVTGTAFNFTPTDATYSTLGRINCDGGVAELVLFKGGTNGDILQTGGKGSLYWLRMVPTKTVAVSVSTIGTGAGTTSILKDDAVTSEPTQTVSKAQTIGVSVVATAATNSKFIAWKNKVDGQEVSKDATYIYTGTADIQLEAVFDLTTSIGEPKSATLNFFPNPATDVVNCSSAVKRTILFSTSGQKVLEGFGNTLNVSNVPTGTYIIQLIGEKGTENSTICIQ